jgi:hypothetical protein
MIKLAIAATIFAKAPSAYLNSTSDSAIAPIPIITP